MAQTSFSAIKHTFPNKEEGSLSFVTSRTHELSLSDAHSTLSSGLSALGVPLSAITINKVYLDVRAKRVGGTANGDIEVYLANSSGSNVGQITSKVSEGVYSNSDSINRGGDMIAKGFVPVLTGTNAGRINHNSATKIVNKITASIAKRYLSTAYIEWGGYITTHKITWQNYDGTVLQTDASVYHGTTPTYKGSTPTRASTSEYTYTFKGWDKTVSAATADTTYIAQFTETRKTSTVTFKNADGSVVSTKSLNNGATLGTLPTVSRSGYTFAGWIPCEPVKKTDGAILDSYQYTGSNSYPLDTKYKYTDKLSVHIEAYMENWLDIGKLTAQIISCTQSGGWGLGYQANTNSSGGAESHGVELYAGGYKGINLGFSSGTDKNTNQFTKPMSWYTFDIVFNQGTLEAYVDGVKKGTQTTTNTTISYNPDNTIFVGAEAGSNVTTPAGGSYFKGLISNVFIANQGTKLQIATTSTTVNGDIEYYPIWRKAHTVTFKNHDGTVLQTVYVDNGSTPSYTGSTPTKPQDTQNTYTFSGWDPTIGAIKADTTYTAQFTATPRKYTITVNAGTGGTVTGGGSYDYNKSVTISAIPNTGYKFVRWSDDNTSSTRTITVTGNATYTAYFEKIAYTITFEDGDGTVLETVTVYHGDLPQCSKTPTKTSTNEYIYTWNTSNPWTPSISVATANQTYIPNFNETKREYTVIFADDNGSVLKTESVAYGSKPTPPTSPIKQDTAQWDYTFDGWYDANGDKWTSATIITSAVTFTARYTSVVQKYLVRWYNEDGSVLLETDENVPYGTMPTYNGETPTKTATAAHSYEHIGWSIDVNSSGTTDLTAVVSSVDYYARFREIDNTYTVKWVNEGVVIETDELVPYGTQPDYNGATPTKDSDDQYDYTFLGWSANVNDPAVDDTQLDTVKGDITYTAVYTKTLKLYSIRVVLFDTEYTIVREYNTEIVIEAPKINGYEFVRWSDGNTDNPRTIIVTNDATYTAEYQESSYHLYINKNISMKILVDTNNVIGVLIDTHRVW